MRSLIVIKGLDWLFKVVNLSSKVSIPSLQKTVLKKFHAVEKGVEVAFSFKVAIQAAKVTDVAPLFDRSSLSILWLVVGWRAAPLHGSRMILLLISWCVVARHAAISLPAEFDPPESVCFEKRPAEDPPESGRRLLWYEDLGCCVVNG